MADERRKLVIIDGSSLIYRAFFAMPGLTTIDGTPTNAVYGYAMMLLKLLEDEKPDILLVAFEGGKTFRHGEFADYKSHRPRTPDDLAVQGPLARCVTEAMRIPMLQCKGYEADDLLGVIACRGADAGFEVLIVTGDLDALQLVGDHVKVLMTRRGVTDSMIYDDAAVRERFGLAPTLLPDFKALKGDSSDNIPGIAGIGDKTATALLQQYGNLENLLDHAEEVSANRVRTNLLEGKENARLYKRLATIHTDLPIETPFDEWTYPGPNVPVATDMFQRLEFRTLARRIGEFARQGATEGRMEAPPPPSEPAGSWRRLESNEDLQDWLDRHAGEPIVLRVMQSGGGSRPGPLRGVALRSGLETIVLGAEGSGGEGLLAAADDPWSPPLALQAWLAGGKARLIAHDLKRDLHALREADCELDVIPAFDTLIAAYVLNPGRSNYPLEDMARELAGVTVPAIAGTAEELAREAAAIGLLHTHLAKRLEADELTAVYYEVDLPLAPVLMRLEAAGVNVNREELGRLSRRLAEHVADLEKQAMDIVGRAVNLGSPKQLQDLLFTELGLPPGRKTKTGYSTDSDVLQDLAIIHPLPAIILSWREMSKLRSTYTDTLQNLIDPRDGRIHTRLSQTVAATGRLSSSDPNLQNIPIRTEVGREIRAAFIPAPGTKLLAADYSQIELRIAAHVSQDAELVRAFQEDRDVHATTAARVYDIPVEQVNSDQRRNAKTVNFAVLYGQREFGLSRQLRIDIGEARKLIDAYFEEFPGVRNFTEETLNGVRRDGFVRTLPPYCRKRYIPAIHSGNRNERMAAEREAVNAPVQGTAADIIKVAMLRVDAAMREANVRSRMILQVHDELLFEVYPEEEDLMCRLVRREMEAAFPLAVPLRADVKLGQNWRDTTPVERGEKPEVGSQPAEVGTLALDL